MKNFFLKKLCLPFLSCSAQDLLRDERPSSREDVSPSDGGTFRHLQRQGLLPAAFLAESGEISEGGESSWIDFSSDESESAPIENEDLREDTQKNIFYSLYTAERCGLKAGQRFFSFTQTSGKYTIASTGAQFFPVYFLSNSTSAGHLPPTHLESGTEALLFSKPALVGAKEYHHKSWFLVQVAGFDDENSFLVGWVQRSALLPVSETVLVDLLEYAGRKNFMRTTFSLREEPGFWDVAVPQRVAGPSFTCMSIEKKPMSSTVLVFDAGNSSRVLFWPLLDVGMLLRGTQELLETVGLDGSQRLLDKVLQQDSESSEEKKNVSSSFVQEDAFERLDVFASTLGKENVVLPDVGPTRDFIVGLEDLSKSLLLPTHRANEWPSLQYSDLTRMHGSLMPVPLRYRFLRSTQEDALFDTAFDSAVRSLVAIEVWQDGRSSSSSKKSVLVGIFVPGAKSNVFLCIDDEVSRNGGLFRLLEEANLNSESAIKKLVEAKPEHKTLREAMKTKGNLSENGSLEQHWREELLQTPLFEAFGGRLTEAKDTAAKRAALGNSKQDEGNFSFHGYSADYGKEIPKKKKKVDKRSETTFLGWVMKISALFLVMLSLAGAVAIYLDGGFRDWPSLYPQNREIFPKEEGESPDTA